MTSATPQARPIPLLREASLREFVVAGSISRVQAVGRTGGYELQVHMGTAGAAGAAIALLGNARGGIRLFGSLDSITALLQRLGVSAFEVDVAHFAPAPLKALRAEISAAAAALTE